MVTWAADFSMGSWGFPWGVQEKAPGRHSSVVDPFGRYPGKVGRVEVRPGDNNVANSGLGERCEALLPPGGVAPSQGALPFPMYGVEGHFEWWAFAVAFDPSSYTDDADWNSVTQWHNSGTSGATSAFREQSAALTFDTVGGDPANGDRRNAPLGDRKAGQWYEFLSGVKWSSDPTKGGATIWRDGSLFATINGPTLYRGESVYFKQGVYRHATPGGTAIVYYYGTCFGDSRADVIAHAFPGSTRWGATPPPPSVDPLVTDANAISDSSPAIKRFAQHAAQRIIALEARP